MTTSPGASGGSRSPTSTPLGQSQDTFISDLPTLTRNQGDLPLANNTLSKCLGYFEGSSSNLLGLMDKVGELWISYCAESVLARLVLIGHVHSIVRHVKSW